jgi:hypothetical protein
MEELRLEYTPLSELQLWDRNPKKHDIGSIIESFKRYGFKSPIQFETAINGGSGGIVAGNGRVEALATMRRLGEKPPVGIVVNNGEWYVPVIHGVYAKTESEAEAFGLDDNNITLLGGDFMPLDIARIWEQDKYIDILEELTHTQLPVSVDGDSLDIINEFLAQEESVSKKDSKVICPNCGTEFVPERKR